MAFSAGKPCALEEVAPTYVGVFTFKSAGAKQPAGRQFSIETGAGYEEDGIPRVERREWTSPHEHPSARRLEAYVANLQGYVGTSSRATQHLTREIETCHGSLKPARNLTAMG